MLAKVLVVLERETRPRAAPAGIGAWTLELQDLAMKLLVPTRAEVVGDGNREEKEERQAEERRRPSHRPQLLAW